MSWRKHETHQEETKDVKTALKEAGINATVGHGKGTAWGWLKINIGAGQQFGEHKKQDENQFRCDPDCKRCINLRAMEEKALKIAQEVTGRQGDYDGNINIHTQDHWSDAQHKKTGNGSIPITHPDWVEVEA